MAALHIFAERQKRRVTLEDRPFASGSQGKVYRLKHHRDYLVKLWEKPTRELGEKVQAMVAHPLPSRSGYRFAGPIERVVDKYGFCLGFIMPRVGGVEIHEVYDPSSREKLSKAFDYRYLVRTAKNLATAVEEVHRRPGWLVTDLSFRNVFVTGRATVGIIDLDSFQVTVNGRLFASNLITPEYAPRELLQGRSVPRTKAQDCHSLAVLTFQLLLGVHPFAAAGDDAVPAEELVQRGLWPYAPGVPFEPSPMAPPLEHFPADIQECFRRAFASSDPRQRPSARKWRKVLSKAEKDLVQCRRDPEHFHFASVHRRCPDCPKTVLNKVADWFESVFIKLST